ncbi:MAG: ABC transporter permease, partial [Duncaniella sp.]|nr:ABC transporter permease [Duncaniella sp.]
DNLLNNDPFRYLGEYSIPIKFKDNVQAERFRAELHDKVNRINAADTAGWVIDLRSAPVSPTLRVLAHSSNGDDLSLWPLIRPLLLILAVLLIIPAINISGMISGQMDRRLAEIGIRRSFGATRNQLTGQVMIENFVLTLVGGFIGLVIAWVVVLTCRTLLLQLLIPTWECQDAPVGLSAEMMFSPVIFLATIIICLILNMLSAYIPVRLSLHRPIISSINSKR